MSVSPSSLSNMAANTTSTKTSRAGVRSTVKNYLPTASHDKFVQIRLKPLLPIILAISALVYYVGQQKRMAAEGNSQASGSWLPIVAESALGCLLLKYTAGVYPLLGLGLAISRASQQNNAMAQLQAVISTAVTMGMGFLGANLMDAELMAKLENNKIKSLFAPKGEEGTKLGRWIDALKAKTGEEHENLKGLGEHLGELKAEYLSELPKWDGKKHPNDKAELRKVLDKIEQFKGQVAEKLAHPGIGQQAIDVAEEHGVKDTAKSLLKHIGEDQSALTKVTRMINPVCCFMFSAFLLGTPIANWINGKLEHNQPDLKKKAMKQVLFPDSQRVLKRSEDHGSHHSGGHTYQVNPGPYITCPDVGDGRPMQ